MKTEGVQINASFSDPPHPYHQNAATHALHPLQINYLRIRLPHLPKHNAMHIIAANPSTGASGNLTFDDNNVFPPFTFTNDTASHTNKLPW
jgi:ribonuclease BN (tRNA processing enzyme)